MITSSNLDKARALTSQMESLDKQGDTQGAITAANAVLRLLEGDESVEGTRLRGHVQGYRQHLTGMPLWFTFGIIGALTGGVTFTILAWLDFFSAEALSNPTSADLKRTLVLFGLRNGTLFFGLLGLIVSQMFAAWRHREVQRHHHVRVLAIPLPAFNTVPSIVAAVWAMVGGALIGAALGWRAVALGLTHPSLTAGSATVLGMQQGWVAGLAMVWLSMKTARRRLANM